MRIKGFVILLLVMLPFAQCKKQDSGGVVPATVYTIQGIAQYTEYTKSKVTVLDSQMVYIKHYADSADTFYVYAVQTDINGYFIFNLPDTGKYIIYTKPGEKSNASFTGSYYASYLTVPFPKDSIKLNAIDTNRENGVNITTVDVNGNFIPGATVTFYASRVVALDDTFCTGAGSEASVVTNAMGMATVTKFQDTVVYFNAILNVDSGYALKRVANSITLGKHGLTSTKVPFNVVTDTLK